MRIVKRVVDPSSFNLEFYQGPEYIGTLKFGSRNQEALAFVEGLRSGELGELVPIDYEVINYLQMTRAR